MLESLRTVSVLSGKNTRLIFVGYRFGFQLATFQCKAINSDVIKMYEV